MLEDLLLLQVFPLVLLVPVVVVSPLALDCLVFVVLVVGMGLAVLLLVQPELV